jgi:hypothetical protein
MLELNPVPKEWFQEVHDLLRRDRNWWDRCEDQLFLHRSDSPHGTHP